MGPPDARPPRTGGAPSRRVLLAGNGAIPAAACSWPGTVQSRPPHDPGGDGASRGAPGRGQCEPGRREVLTGDGTSRGGASPGEASRSEARRCEPPDLARCSHRADVRHRARCAVRPGAPSGRRSPPTSGPPVVRHPRQERCPQPGPRSAPGVSPRQGVVPPPGRCPPAGAWSPLGRGPAEAVSPAGESTARGRRCPHTVALGTVAPARSTPRTIDSPLGRHARLVNAPPGRRARVGAPAKSTFPLSGIDRGGLPE